MITIKIEGSKELQADFKKAPELIAKKITEAIRKSTVVIKQNIARKAPVFDGTLKKSIDSRVIKMRGEVGISERASKYGYVQEYGRRAGSRMPPVNALKRWAIAKTGDEDMAFPIARSIARKGTKPQPFFKPGVEQSMSDVNRYLEEAALHIVNEI